ncbi:MAG: hypothetical protein K0Q83_358 [Deltaproteobacteria bacterium]|nr:hypothetical protein [Deltaproteobacteria bacterium]
MPHLIDSRLPLDHVTTLPEHHRKSTFTRSYERAAPSQLSSLLVRPAFFRARAKHGSCRPELARA